MKNKISVYIIFVILTANILCTKISANNNLYNNIITVGEIEQIIDGIVVSQQESMKVSSIDEFINKGLAKYAGTSLSDWFVIALRQYKESFGYSFDGYLSALDKYVKNTANLNATDTQRISLAYAALYNKIVADNNVADKIVTDKIVTNKTDRNEFISKALDASIGKLGIMSYIYGLLLLDCNDYTSDRFTRDEVLNDILSLRLEDGGWALMGDVSDPDITAMTVQALAPYYEKNNIKPIIDEALTLLSEKQLEDGDYSSWGTRNAETAAQVIVALCALGIDCQRDERFIKNGNTLIDGLLEYRLSDGSFSHTPDGLSDSSATAQTMYSLVAVWRQMNGLSVLYDFTADDIVSE
ncbi:MAG: hypothetical protein K0S55_1112, partial [Clostridia bacterium]|nr:hypothetical protein [Clostridia bacterium]